MPLELSRELLRAEKLTDLLDLAAKAVCRDLPATDVAIFLYQKDGRIARANSQGSRLETYAQGEGTVGRTACDSRGPQIGTNDTFEWPDDELKDAYEQQLGRQWSYACFPLNGPNRTYGVLRVFRGRDAGAFDETTLASLSVFTHQIAISISHLRREQELALLMQVGRVLATPATSIGEVAKKVANGLTAPLTEYAACTIRIANRQGDLDLCAAVGSPYVNIASKSHEARHDDQGIVGKVFTSGEAVIIADVPAEIDRFYDKQWILKNAIRTFACFPIKDGDRTFGTLSIFLLYHYEFYETRIRFFGELSKHLAYAITVARLLQTRSELISSQKSVVSNVLAVDTILQTIVDNGVEITGAAAGYIALRSRRDNKLHARVQTLNLPPHTIPEIDITGKGLTAKAVREGRSINCPDVSISDIYVDFDGERHGWVKSELVVPLLYAGWPIGIANFEAVRVAHFTSDDQLLLESLAAQAAVLVQRARFVQSAEHLATIALPRGDVDQLVAGILTTYLAITDARLGLLGTFKGAHMLTVRGSHAINILKSWDDDDLELPSVAQETIDQAMTANEVRISAAFDGEAFVGIPHLKDSVRAVAIPLAVGDTDGEKSADREFVLLVIGERDVFFDEEIQLLSALAVAAGLALSEASLLIERDKLFATARQQTQLLSIAEVTVGISHDARNMLNNVTSAYRVAKKTISARSGAERDAKLEAELTKIEEGLRTLRIHYDTIKQFSRYGSPVFALRDINQIVRDGLMLISHRIGESRIKVKLELNGQRVVTCDRDKLLQVIVNLVTNAIEAMKPGGKLFVGSSEYGDGGVEVRITDDGSGIDDELRTKIFKPLFTTKERGTGIGLAVCKQIVEGVHAGRLDFESRRGRTTFYVRLPAVPEMGESQ